MGNVAASGGYYIACPADVIVAQPNTITGSIGVFGLFVNAKNLMKNKLGITFDVVTTNPYSDIGNPFRSVTGFERAIFQQAVEEVYDTFLTRVAEGRKMKKDDVDKIGEGRVWSGADAKRIGLVDELGGLEDAIRIAAQKAKLETYRITELPEREDPLEKLIEDLSLSTLLGTWGHTSLVSPGPTGEAWEYLRQLQSLLKNNGILMRMPEIITVN
jgi:protease-4